MTVLVTLLFVAAAALRGYVPGAEVGPRPPPSDNPVVTAAVVGLLVASVTVVAVAVVTRLRNRSASPPSMASRPDWSRGDLGRPTWRMALIAFGVVLGWLLVSILLSRLGAGLGDDDADGAGATPTATDAASSTPDAGGAAPPMPPEADPGTNLLSYFYAATAVFVVVLVIGTIVAARRRGPLSASAPDVDHPGGVAEAGSQSLALAAEVGLAEVEDLSREPRKAIIACYAAMERQLSLLPDAAPRDFDTASEVLARAVDHHALAPDSATQLVDLFEEARFSPHVMNEGHRDAAVAVLTQVLDELRSRV
ncbi:DUF4129 domain-containing protein [Mycolicibacterium sp. P1-18]|uniref:DUF4129 domain-containing protein n=1 Tax=Mycolicibacterium sp. P1-18 TaxID=2024615 RepID=UPI001F5BA4FB|nr:DUF4129 domain-containing protein [Mycolicibacterium sp. P1-18]